MRLSEIEWEVDRIDAGDLDLPTELEIDVQAEGIKNYEDLENWLSNTYGWLVMSYSSDMSLEPQASTPSPR
jgi:hypothetical protein